MIDAVSAPSVPASEGDENADEEAAYGVLENGVDVPVVIVGEAKGLIEVWVLVGDELAVDCEEE